MTTSVITRFLCGLELREIVRLIAYFGIGLSIVAVIATVIDLTVSGSNVEAGWSEIRIPSWFITGQAILVSSGCGLLIVGANQGKRRFVGAFIGLILVSLVGELIIVVPWMLQVIRHGLGIVNVWAQTPVFLAFVLPLMTIYSFVLWTSSAFFYQLGRRSQKQDRVPCVDLSKSSEQPIEV